MTFIVMEVIINIATGKGKSRRNGIDFTESLWYSGQLLNLVRKPVSFSRPPDLPECCQTRRPARIHPAMCRCAHLCKHLL